MILGRPTAFWEVTNTNPNVQVEAGDVATYMGDASSFLFTLVTGPRRSLSRKLSDTKVYAPYIRALLGNHNTTMQVDAGEVTTYIGGPCRIYGEATMAQPAGLPPKLQLPYPNVQRFRGGLVFKAHRLCVPLNSRLESNNEEEKKSPPS